jgi:sulfite reductase (NADPH) flavoprotein alpha-component
MVCAGSGIGPFYGFLRHFEEQRKLYRGPLGQAWLIFGCRSRRLDYLYEDELQQLAEYGVLGRLTVCFSRDKEHIYSSGDKAAADKDELSVEATETDNGSGDKTSFADKMSGKYVQHGMAEVGGDLAAWILEMNARFYVCGDAANMGRAVHDALVQVLDMHGGSRLGAEGAAEYVSRMVVEKRYLQDLWT